MISVTIYTTTNCPFSKQLKEFLYKNDLPFTEIKADENKENALKLQKLDSSLRTPIIELKTDDCLYRFLGWSEVVQEQVKQIVLR